MSDHKTKKHTWVCRENKDGQLYIDNLGGIYIEVRYCPFCGRKSKKIQKLKELKTERY